MLTQDKARLDMLIKKHKDNRQRVPVERNHMIELFIKYYEEMEQSQLDKEGLEDEESKEEE